MQVEIQYIEGCPSLPLALARVRAALAALGMDAEVSTTMMPNGIPFAGSPTVLIGGWDVCPPGLIPVVGSSCRTYQTTHGLEGAPSVGAIKAAIRAVLEKYSHAV